MRSISIGDDFDIHVGPDRNLTIAVEKEACRQSVLLASLMLRGENPLATEQGVPYMETMFQRKRPFEFEQALREEIASVPNVISVESITLLQLDEMLQYQATVQTIYGPVNT